MQLRNVNRVKRKERENEGFLHVSEEKVFFIKNALSKRVTLSPPSRVNFRYVNLRA